MRIVFPIIIVLFVFFGKGTGSIEYSETAFPPNVTLDKPPEFFVLDWKEGTKLSPKKTAFFLEIDSLVRQEVIALVNEQLEPVLYTADISTPVCADGECKLMNMKFYWTLLGEYAGFDRYLELPLTKHDHDEFRNSDYQRLHELLGDDKSILGRRSIDELVEKPKIRTVNGVDALSGATIAEVKQSVVSGALYSCYTAWHLVHGEIRKTLKKNTLSVLTNSMLNDMLYSQNQEYQLFVLQRITASQFKKHVKKVAEIFRFGTPLIRSIIAKSLATKLKDFPDLQRPFWEDFADVDFGTRSLLLRQLNTAPEFSIQIVSNVLSAMSKNQLRTFINFLSQREEVSTEIENSLVAFANSDKETYSYMVEEYLANKKHQ